MVPPAKDDNPGDKLRGAVDTGRMAVLIDRRTYWQAAFIIPKGAAEQVKERGIGWLRAEMQATVPRARLLGGASPTPQTCTCFRSRSTGSIPGTAPASSQSATRRTR